jgi:hypothetical protein
MLIILHSRPGLENYWVFLTSQSVGDFICNIYASPYGVGLSALIANTNTVLWVTILGDDEMTLCGSFSGLG